MGGHRIGARSADRFRFLVFNTLLFPVDAAHALSSVQNNVPKRHRHGITNPDLTFSKMRRVNVATVGVVREFWFHRGRRVVINVLKFTLHISTGHNRRLHCSRVARVVSVGATWVSAREPNLPTSSIPGAYDRLEGAPHLKKRGWVFL